MKMKMTAINGTMVLVVSGTNQALIIQEQDDGFVVEFVDTTHGAAQAVATTVEPMYMQDAPPAAPPTPQATNASPPIVQEDTPQTPLNNDLFQQLTQLRKTLAGMEKVPPYLVFHDKTLREMADTMPANMQEMGNISGVGQAKLEKYGPVFLEAIHGVAV